MCETTTLFKQFFTNLSNGNQEKFNELIKFSQDVINETLDENKPVIEIVGSGSNGKSALIRILCELVAPKMMIADVNTLKNIYTTFSESIRYIIVNDLDSDDIKLFSGIVKELSGDDPIYVRTPVINNELQLSNKGQCYLLPVRSKDEAPQMIHKFVPNVKFIHVTNYSINHDDPGFNRRKRIVQMNAEFTALNPLTDHNIANKLLIHKDELREFIINYKEYNPEKAIKPTHTKIIIENIIDNTFKSIDVQTDTITTIHEYIGNAYSIDAKHNMIKLQETKMSVETVLQDKTYIGAYLVQINDNLYELYMKTVRKVNNGWVFNNFIDRVETQKIGRFICL